MTSTIERPTTDETDRCSHPVGVVPTINRTPVPPSQALEYVTCAEAAEAIDSKPYPVLELARRGGSTLCATAS